MADSVFLDANVLFSAAYREGSTLLRLWDLPGVSILTSGYAAEEALRNAVDQEHLRRLNTLLFLTEITSCEPDAQPVRLPDELMLHEKDRPILLAALHARATHLITGDKQHFGHLFGTIVQGICIQTPSAYLQGRESES